MPRLLTFISRARSARTRRLSALSLVAALLGAAAGAAAQSPRVPDERGGRTPKALAEQLGRKQQELELREAAAFNPDPVSARPAARSAVGRESAVQPGIYGTFSVQDFQGQAPRLKYTHASAAGFRDFLSRYYQPNFVNRDRDVTTFGFHDSPGDNFDT